jgi:hypothetical protein
MIAHRIDDLAGVLDDLAFTRENRRTIRSDGNDKKTITTPMGPQIVHVSNANCISDGPFAKLNISSAQL